jgi:hypothetical protein
VLNLTLTGYSVNGSLDLVVHSDQWIWAGEFVLSEYATVKGIVLGNPSGDPLFNANVSACSTLLIPGQPTGPCFDTVATDVDGRFVLSIPAGSYILNFSLLDYNSTYIPVDLLPGEYVNVGAVFLEQFGSIVGSVYGADTDAPLKGANVQACPLWVAGNCSLIVDTGANGQYTLTGAPGSYVISASAPGYENAYADALIKGGLTSTVLPIYLIPSSTDTFYTLKGSVVGGGTLGPLNGAVVSAGDDYATATNGAGAFTLQVPWGVYVVSAAFNGYATQSRVISVHENQTGIDFVLPQAVFTISGVTRDGLTDQPVATVGIYAQGQLLATSDSSGDYALTLPNGTYHLAAFPTGIAASVLAATDFTVALAGSNAVRNIELFPASAEVYGLIVNSYTGAPLANVTITVNGLTVDNIAWSNTYTTGPTGGFFATLYAGRYTVNATLAGYVGTVTTVAPTTNSSLEVNLGLRPISNNVAAANAGPIGLTPALLLGALVVVGATAYLLPLRTRTRSTDGVGRAISTTPPAQIEGGRP